jgi:hypothetical protein
VFGQFIEKIVVTLTCYCSGTELWIRPFSPFWHKNGIHAFDKGWQHASTTCHPSHSKFRSRKMTRHLLKLLGQLLFLSFPLASRDTVTLNLEVFFSSARVTVVLTHPLTEQWNWSLQRTNWEVKWRRRHFDKIFSHPLAPVSRGCGAARVTYVYTNESSSSRSVVVQQRLICFCCRNVTLLFICLLGHDEWHFRLFLCSAARMP